MDLQHLRASDGTGEAVLAHVSSPRTIGSTVLELDNVDNWNTKCVVVTGTPAANGYIATAGMTIMYGHLTAGDFIIDGYAPGYADNGNTTTEIAIVKMTTNWADALVDILSIAHQDNGKLKVTSLDDFFKPSDVANVPFVASGGVIALTAGLTASFSDLVYYIQGLRYTKTGVANRLYTASKDTYVDIGTDGTLDYTEVANGAASPALSANHIRLAKVITSGVTITSVIQYGSDSLKNLIYNQERGFVRKDSVSREKDQADWGPGGGTSIVPDTTFDLTCQGGRDVMVFFCSNQIYLTAGTVTIDVYMDGVNQGEIARQSTSNLPASGMFRIPNVAPGVHSFSIRTQNSGGSYQFTIFRSQSVAYWEV